MRIAIYLLIVTVVSGTAAAQKVTGIVLDQDGAAIKDARVALTDGETTVVQTVTDAEGSFSLVGTITSGSRLTVTAYGFSPSERQLSPNGVYDFTIVLEPLPITSDLLVSITRTETRLAETPASVVLLNRAALDSTASLTTDDALRQVAGFSLFRRSSSKTSNPTTQGANLRGLAGSGASRASVLLDGLSLNDAFGGWTYWSRVPRAAVDRIEVLRGGASSLYGASALSGAVSIETMRGNDEPALRLETSAGTNETFEGSLFGSYAKAKWSIDLMADVFRTAGYIPTAEAERGIVDSEADSRHENGLFTITRRFASANEGRIFLRGTLFSERRDNGTRLTDNRTYFRQLAGGVDFSDTLFGTFRLRSFVETQVYDQTFSAISNSRNIETLSRLQRVPSQALGVSGLWSKSFDRHFVTAGIELRDVRGFSDETIFVSGNATSSTGSGGRERSLGFFVQDAWRIASRFSLHFGARYDHWKHFGALASTRTITTGITATTQFPERNDDSLSPRAAVIVEVNPSLSVFASLSSSFRAPTLNELYRVFRVGNVLTLANEDLKAERARSIDAGVSIKGAGGRLWLRGSVFSTTISDPVVSVTLSSSPTLIIRQRQNVGRTRAIGVEFDGEFRVRADLKLSGALLWVDSRIVDFSASPGFEGNFIPQVARRQLTFQTVYSPSRFTVAIQGRAASHQFEDDQNLLRLRPYFTADVHGSYQISRVVRVFCAVENIFNSRYDLGLTPNRTVAAPRSLRLGLRFDLSKR